VRQQ
jgi:hypothetical protein